MKVGIHPSFFKKERNQAYVEWVLSFWRELFQNAIDQRCTRIDVRMESLDNGNVQVVFEDNGPGMSRETLENVYFAVGATTKGGAGHIGGFGRARILTCFAMASYQIRSHDYLATGSGDEYDIEDAEYFPGCRLTIEVDDTTIVKLDETLHQFLGESNMSPDVYINEVFNFVQCNHRGRCVNELKACDGDRSFAKVYVNKSAPLHRVIIRVHGMSMFSVVSDVKAQVVIEIDPAVARDVLTANRDGLRIGYDGPLYRLLREMAVDTQNSIKDRFKRHTQIIRGGGMKRIRKPTQKAATKTTGHREIIGDPVVVGLPDPRRENDSPSLVIEETVGHSDLARNQFGSWMSRMFGDIYVFDETNVAAMHSAVPRYLPKSWQPMEINGRTVMKGTNSLKLLLIWKVAVEYAIEVGLEPLGIEELPYAVGFVFDDCIANHRYQNGGHVFALRPVTKEGKSAYSVRDRQSLKRIMTCAKHEVSHVVVSWHNEDFSVMREAIDERFDESECLKRMKKALKYLPDFTQSSMQRAA